MSNSISPHKASWPSPSNIARRNRWNLSADQPNKRNAPPLCNGICAIWWGMSPRRSQTRKSELQRTTHGDWLRHRRRRHRRHPRLWNRHFTPLTNLCLPPLGRLRTVGLFTPPLFSSAHESCLTIMDYLRCDDLVLPTTKGVAHIGACSVELSEESSLRIIFTLQRNNESQFRNNLSLLSICQYVHSSSLKESVVEMDFLQRVHVHLFAASWFTEWGLRIVETGYGRGRTCSWTCKVRICV